MAINVGDTLILYTARNNKLNIHEGIVTFDTKSYYREYVVFEDGHYREHVPNVKKVGRVIGYGPRLWLFERNDILARKLFVEYEEAMLAKMEKAVERKKRLIETLREGMEE